MPSRQTDSKPRSPDQSRETGLAGGLNSEASRPSAKTFGLSDGWDPAVAWAHKNSVVSELLLTIDAVLLHGHDRRFGSVLKELTSPYATKLLESWASREPAAGVLARVSLAARRDATLFEVCPPLTTGKSARQQLDDLRRDYLFAMLLEQHPLGSPSDREWVATIRLWTFAHAVKRALSGNAQDKLLRTVATGIRSACGGSDAWSGVLRALDTPAEAFDEINGYLRFRATTLRDASPRFYSAVAAIADGLSDQEPLSDALGAGGLLYQSLPPAQRLPSAEIPTFEFETEHDGSQTHRTWPADDADEGGDLFESKADPTASYFHQSLSANSVLLLSAEELQFLPWSWSHINSAEFKDLERWIDVLLGHQQPSVQLLGCFVWIACRAGRSLRRALDIGISAETGDDWSLCPRTTRLHRLPAARHSGWRPSSAAERDWVRAVASKNELDLLGSVQAILHSLLLAYPEAKRLGELWSDVAKPESLFTTLKPSELDRITPGMLGYVLPHRLFVDTADAAMTRLVASHPKSGMPGACAYANWSSVEVDRRLARSNPTLTIAGHGEPPIGGGSRLDVIEPLLIEAIRNGAAVVEQLARSADMVGFHNAYTVYVVVTLLAATGARPVVDPFESIDHFDFERWFVYINDKSSSETREDRLVPLPRAISDWIRESYIRYLALLSQQLAAEHPHLAHEIQLLTQPGVERSMPLFFLLTETGELTWSSVSEQAVEASEIFGWPLPLNLFRHRLAQILRRLGLDPEIIDAILGHSDNAASTHGDRSFRVWGQDMEVARPHLDRCFKNLDLPLIRCGPRALAVPRSSHSKGDPARLFGIAARAHNRAQRTLQAREHAGFLLKEHLGKRVITELTEDEADRLATVLLFTESGLPRTLAHVYYSVLIEALDQAWDEIGKRVRLRKRYSWAKPLASPFTAEAPGAIARVAKLREFLDGLVSGVHSSQLSYGDVSALAVLMLCLDHGIASLQLLGDVAARRNFRVICLKSQYSLEYGNAIADHPGDPDIAVSAFPISPRTASVLDRHLSGKRAASSWDKPIPKRLLPMLAILGRDDGGTSQSTRLKDLMEVLATNVDQANVMTMPGVVAGYAAGRVVSCSLGWRDRIRLAYDEIPVLAGPDADESEIGTEVDVGAVNLRPPPLQGPSELQVAAHEFLKDLRHLLATAAAEEIRKRRDDRQESTANGLNTTGKDTAAALEAIADSLTESDRRSLNTKLARKRRKELARRVAAHHKAWSGRVSSAIFLLGQWTSSLVFRQKRTRELLTISAVERYLGALSRAFEETAYAADLLSMDEEEVTALYEQVLTIRSQENSAYVAARLAEFHRWASGQGVEDPDWSALPETVHSGGVSPGLLTEVEYQDALRLLLHDPDCSQAYALAQAFLLLCCQRFGLRGAEALGLMRRDWCDNGADGIVIYVRENRFRSLKSQASRRQVPLLFGLSLLEKEVIRRYMVHAEAAHGDAATGLVFAEVAEHGLKQLRMTMTRTVNRVLKSVTGNPRISLHHVRHTAVNRLALQLSGVTCWPLLAALDGASVDLDEAELILLGRLGATRRSCWALARYLGHAGTGTIFRNYLHFVDQWMREILSESLSKPALGRFSHAINLDEVPRSARPSTDLLATPPAASAAITTDLVLAFLRMLARGKTGAELAVALGIPADMATPIHEAVLRVGRQMRLSQATSGKPLKKACKRKIRGRDAPRDTAPKYEAKPADPLEFLGRVTQKGWARLLTKAKEVEQKIGHEGVCSPLPINLDSAARMIGATRQIVLWTQDHFLALRWFVDLFGIDSDRFTVLHSPTWTEKQMRAAAEAGFEIAAGVHGEGATQVQLDSGFDGENDNRVENRCAFLFKQNSNYWVRNRLELAIVFVATVAAHGRHVVARS